MALSLAVLAIAWVARRFDSADAFEPAPFIFSGVDEAGNIDPAQRIDDTALLKRAAEALRHVDSNSLADLGTVMRVAGSFPTEADVVKYRQQLRMAGFKAMTPEALTVVLRDFFNHNPPEQQRTEILEAWNLVDVDGDGVISAGAEMKHLVEMLTTMGEPLSDDEMEEFIKEMDVDRDGHLSHREFMRVLADEG